MKSYSVLLRVPALFLGIALGAPAPAHALRAAGVEEKAVDQALAVSSEAMQGPGVVVIDTGMFPRQAGLEEFLARLPDEGRFIVVGAGSALAWRLRHTTPA